MPVIGDFLQPVYDLTNRPDFVSETTSFLNRALQRAHNRGEYRFDVQEADFAYAGSQELSGALPARFKKYYSVISDADIRLHEVSPAALFDDYVQMEKRNTFYIAGTNINFRMTDAFSEITLTYLQTPTFADSYIATNYPELLHYLAASSIFRLMGNQQKMNFWLQEALAIQEEIERNHFIP